MSLPVVDCRSLVEFCRAYEQHRKNAAFNNSPVNHHHRSRSNRANCHTSRCGVCLDGLADSFCDQFTFSAVIDILLLLVVIGALAVLVLPYLTFLVHQASEIFLVACFLVGDLMNDVPLSYLACSVVGFFGAVILWAFLTLKSQKCGKPYCKGLRKSVEFDIQLETEQCIKCYPPASREEAFGAWPVDLGEDRNELEAELKKMAPINGRTVLIFRAPCGCLTGRMEVWGPKKVSRIKK